jgi:hypothetical protein
VAPHRSLQPGDLHGMIHPYEIYKAQTNVNILKIVAAVLTRVALFRHPNSHEHIPWCWREVVAAVSDISFTTISVLNITQTVLANLPIIWPMCSRIVCPKPKEIHFDLSN